eukprot:Rmarinus@m.25072
MPVHLPDIQNRKTGTGMNGSVGRRKEDRPPSTVPLPPTHKRLRDDSGSRTARAFLNSHHGKDDDDDFDVVEAEEEAKTREAERGDDFDMYYEQSREALWRHSGKKCRLRPTRSRKDSNVPLTQRPRMAQSLNVEMIRPLVDLVRSHYEETQRDAAAALFSLATEKGNKAAFIKAGAVNALVEMAKSKDIEIRRAASGALYHLSKNSHAIKMRLVDAGAVLPLLKLTRSQDRQAMRYASGAVKELCESDVIRSKLVNAGALPALFALVHSRDGSVRHHAGWTLARLAHIPGMGDKLLDQGCLNPFVALLKSSDIEVRRQAASALCALSKEEVKLRFTRELGTLQPIYDALHNNNDQPLRHYLLRTLQHIALENTLHPWLAKEKCAPEVVKLASSLFEVGAKRGRSAANTRPTVRPADVDIARLLSLCLSLMTATSEISLSLSTPEQTKTLIDLASMEDRRLRRHVATALSHMASFDHNHECKSMIKLGVVKPLLVMIHSADFEVLQDAMKTLSALCTVPEGRKKITSISVGDLVQYIGLPATPQAEDKRRGKNGNLPGVPHSGVAVAATWLTPAHSGRTRGGLPGVGKAGNAADRAHANPQPTSVDALLQLNPSQPALTLLVPLLRVRGGELEKTLLKLIMDVAAVDSAKGTLVRSGVVEELVELSHDSTDVTHLSLVAMALCNLTSSAHTEAGRNVNVGMANAGAVGALMHIKQLIPPSDEATHTFCKKGLANLLSVFKNPECPTSGSVAMEGQEWVHAFIPPPSPPPPATSPKVTVGNVSPKKAARMHTSRKLSVGGQNEADTSTPVNELTALDSGTHDNDGVPAQRDADPVGIEESPGLAADGGDDVAPATSVSLTARTTGVMDSSPRSDGEIDEDLPSPNES